MPSGSLVFGVGEHLGEQPVADTSAELDLDGVRLMGAGRRARCRKSSTHRPAGYRPAADHHLDRDMYTKHMDGTA